MKRDRIDELARTAQANLGQWFPEAAPGSRVEALHDDDDRESGGLVVRNGRKVWEIEVKKWQPLGLPKETEEAQSN